MINLIVAALFFVGTHVGVSSTALRPQLIERLGENGYRALYSLVALAALAWLIVAYGGAAYVPLPWEGRLGWINHLFMLPAALLAVCAFSQPNPTAVGQNLDPNAAEPAVGILRVTRHPFMWAVALWGVGHVLANGDLGSLVFFGAFAVLALAGAWQLDERKTFEGGPGWGVFVQRTSFVPFGAIAQGRNRFAWREIGFARLIGALGLYAALIYAHPWLFGVAAVG